MTQPLSGVATELSTCTYICLILGAVVASLRDFFRSKASKGPFKPLPSKVAINGLTAHCCVGAAGFICNNLLPVTCSTYAQSEFGAKGTKQVQNKGDLENDGNSNA